MTVNVFSAAFSPDSLTGLQLWLKSDVGVTGGATVTQWNDQSGNGRNLTAVSGNPNGTTNTLNGKNVVTFTLDTMQISSQNLNTGWGITTAFTVILVKKNDTSANVLNGVYYWTAGGSNDFTFWDTYNDNFMYLDCGPLSGGGRITGVPTGGGTSTWDRVYARRNGTAGDVIRNGTTVLTGTYTGNPSLGSATNNFDIGAVGTIPCWNGQLAEMCVYNRSLTASEYTQFDTYINQRWGI